MNENLKSQEFDVLFKQKNYTLYMIKNLSLLVSALLIVIFLIVSLMYGESWNYQFMWGSDFKMAFGILIVIGTATSIVTNLSYSNKKKIENAQNVSAAFSDNKFCPHCGSKLESGSMFCKNCGKEL